MEKILVTLAKVQDPENEKQRSKERRPNDSKAKRESNIQSRNAQDIPCQPTTPANQKWMDTDDPELIESQSSVFGYNSRCPVHRNTNDIKEARSNTKLQRIVNIRASRANNTQQENKHNHNTVPPINIAEESARCRSSHQRGSEPSHFQLLNNEFQKKFGLPVDSGKRRKICSFDGVQIAEGYEKVVTTWQGMFFQLKGEDITFENLRKDNRRDNSRATWRTKGVEVFKVWIEESRDIPKPHRFAVKPPQSWLRPCNPLKPGRWYVHVYQTKIETGPNIYSSLPSRTMARELKQALWKQLHPETL